MNHVWKKIHYLLEFLFRSGGFTRDRGIEITQVVEKYTLLRNEEKITPRLGVTSRRDDE